MACCTKIPIWGCNSDLLCRYQCKEREGGGVGTGINAAFEYFL